MAGALHGAMCSDWLSVTHDQAAACIELRLSLLTMLRPTRITNRTPDPSTRSNISFGVPRSSSLTPNRDPASDGRMPASGSGSQLTTRRLTLNRLIESTERIEKMVTEIQKVKVSSEGQRQKLPKELSVQKSPVVVRAWTCP